MQQGYERYETDCSFILQISVEELPLLLVAAYIPCAIITPPSMKSVCQVLQVITACCTQLASYEGVVKLDGLCSMNSSGSLTIHKCEAIVASLLRDALFSKPWIFHRVERLLPYMTYSHLIYASSSSELTYKAFATNPPRYSHD